MNIKKYIKKDLVIIDDDISCLELLEYNFLKAGYHTICFHDSGKALTYLNEHKVDAIITDWMMPDYDGLELISRTKNTENSSTLKIMISCKEAEHDVIEALKSGVDDYMIKPLRIKELLTRVSILLAKQQKENYSDEILHFDRLILNKSKFEAKVDQEKLKLSKFEFMMLELMILNAGRLMSRSYLLENIHGADTVSTPRSIDVIIHSLRGKLLKYEFNHIQTIYGMGYKFE